MCTLIRICVDTCMCVIVMCFIDSYCTYPIMHLHTCVHGNEYMHVCDCILIRYVQTSVRMVTVYYSW